MALGPLFAQDGVSPDRPGFGNGTSIVTGLQLEAGYEYSKVEKTKTNVFGLVTLRIPYKSWIEFRVGGSSFASQSGSGSSVSEFQDLSLGSKFLLLKGSDHFELTNPRVTLIVESTVPTGGNNFGSDQAQPGTSISAGWPLNEKWSANVNLFYLSAYDGSRSNDFSGVVSLGYVLGTRLSTYFETYALYPESGGSRQYIGHGWAYLPNPSLQIDFNGGVGLNGDSPDFFAGLGVACRF